MELIVGWVALSVVVAFVAGARGRSHVGWLAFSLCLSPILGLILVLVLARPDQGAVLRDGAGQIMTIETHVRCPDCRELVRADARKCKHCAIALIPIT